MEVQLLAVPIYNTPRATIQFKLGSKLKKTRSGLSQVLPPDKEAKLMVWIKEPQRKGLLTR